MERKVSSSLFYALSTLSQLKQRREMQQKVDFKSYLKKYMHKDPL